MREKVKETKTEVQMTTRFRSHILGVFELRNP